MRTFAYASPIEVRGREGTTLKRGQIFVLVTNLVLVATIATPAMAAPASVEPLSSTRVLDGGPLPPSSWSDFNDDGYDDLAIGAPYESVTPPGSQSALAGAGAVHVLYGGPNGLTANNSQRWTVDNVVSWTTSQAGAHFGWAVTVGNFDNDAYGDLAIGAPHTDDTNVDIGALAVLYGGPNGLSAADAIFETGRQTFGSGAHNGMEYGYALAAGDLYWAANGEFDYDGRVEVIAGAPGTNGGRGMLMVRALNSNSRHFSFGFGQSPGAADPGDRCGESLAVGDFDNNEGDDIAIGCPKADDVQTDSGCVGLFTNDLTSDALFCQLPSIDAAEQNDHFGLSLATGDFNRDGADDLVVGVPNENLGSLVDAGMVHIFFGNVTGGIDLDPLTLTQESAPVPGSSATKDRFGAAFAVGDFNGPSGADDWHDSLAIGVPGDDVGSIDRAGAVVVLYWQNGVLATSGNQRWTQNSNNILEKAATTDWFGSALAAGRFRGSSTASALAIGVPFEDLSGPIADAGAVNVLYGTANGLRAAGNQIWHQNSTGIADNAEPGDRFGSALVAGPLP